VRFYTKPPPAKSDRREPKGLLEGTEDEAIDRPRRPGRGVGIGADELH
jgi:hypothetical protein